MKKLIMCIAIIMIICIATAWADPAGTVSPGNSALQATTGAWGLLADTHDMVMTHETIQQRQADIRQDVQDIRGDILGNLTTGHEAVQDQRQVMRNGTWQNMSGNLTTGREDIREQQQAMMVYVNQSRVALVDNVTDLRSEIQAERQTMLTEMGNLTDAQKQVLKNQLNVWIATHSLMEMQGLAGGVGPQIANIAEDLNTSSSAVAPLEQRIDDRSAFMRFLFGGDRDAANQINATVVQNDQRIQEMEQLMQNATLQPDVQQEMQDQIATLQQEQDRLSNFSATERNATGIFWWI